MRVAEIQQRETQADHKPYWKVLFQGTRTPLIAWDKPAFKEGDNIPAESLILDSEKQVYSLKGDSRAEEASTKDSSIREQTAVKAIIDLFCAGKMQDFQESNDYLVTTARAWITAALLHGPVTSHGLKGKVEDINGKPPFSGATG